ncbi:MAG: glycosyltransferase family 2 protein [Rhodobacteraceae bacterium]|nr:glycosyltransferase family 2 protein [Paracoccaceae bacterium]
MTIDVLVPVHWKGIHNLHRAVNSILVQPLYDVRVHILLSGKADAAATGNYLNFLEKAEDRVTIHYREDHLSAGMARNFLIDAVQGCGGGACIAFLDSDDEWCTNHLQQFLDCTERKRDIPLLYSASYLQRQSGRIVRPQGNAPSIWRLTRQPLLLSSVVITHLPASLRFHPCGAEDLIFFANALDHLDTFVGGEKPSVIYDQRNWAQKTCAFKINRTFRAYRTIFRSRIKAGFFLCLFSVHYGIRRMCAYINRVG